MKSTYRVFHNAATVSEHTQFICYVQVEHVWDSDTIQPPDVININTLTKLLTLLRNEWVKHLTIQRQRAPCACHLQHTVTMTEVGTIIQSLQCNQGRIQDLDLGGWASRAPNKGVTGTKSIWEGCPLKIGDGSREKALSSPQNFFFIFGSQMRILVHSPTHLHMSICFCTAIRPGPDLQYACPCSLTFQADCGSIKGAGVPAEEDTEHYLPWWWKRDQFNYCQRRNTESRRQQTVVVTQCLFSDGHKFEGRGDMAPCSPLHLDPPLTVMCRYWGQGEETCQRNKKQSQNDWQETELPLQNGMTDNTNSVEW